MVDKQRVLDYIAPKTAKFEGFMPKVYKCPAGFDTIGYGRNIEANPLKPYELAQLNADGSVSQEVALEWLKEELGRCFDKAFKNYNWFRNLDTERAGAIVDMIYNLGFNGFAGFRNTINLISKGDYKGASINLQKSKWWAQTKSRAIAIVDVILNGGDAIVASVVLDVIDNGGDEEAIMVAVADILEKNKDIQQC